MNTKRIFLSAIIAALPFGAMATQTIVETNTPAAVGANGTVSMAATSGPYVTNEPTVADQTHIATTAYVKGAYNDSIRAVNKLDSDKQDTLYNSRTNAPISATVVEDEFLAMVDDAVRQSVNSDYYISSLPAFKNAGFDTQLATAAGVAESINMAAAVLNDHVNESKQDKLYNDNGDELDSATVAYDEFLAVTDDIIRNTQNAFIGDQAYAAQLVTANEVVDSIKLATNYIGDTIDSKRVRIYTTWGTDTAAATTLVPFEMAQ